MDLIEAERATAARVAAAAIVDPRGGGTHREVGGPAPRGGTAVTAPTGIVAYEPADLTVSVGAGTTVAELAAVLAAEGQECALDPRDPAATVGGTLAVGLSGPRRLRLGPLRDQLLEVRFATADGRLVRGGGPTVKNVTGYDIPRLLVGSFGTLGVLTRVILRCRPHPPAAGWFAGTDEPSRVRDRCYRPSTVFWDGRRTSVRLEGHHDDLERQTAGAGLEPTEEPAWPSGAHRGRASLGPARIVELRTRFADLDGIRWLAEVGVGTVHIAADTQDALAAARAATHACGGWMLREAGAPDLDGFGVPAPNGPLAARLQAAFDPTGKLAPGRLPVVSSAPSTRGPQAQREAEAAGGTS